MTSPSSLGSGQVGMIQFPGSNCDRDCEAIIRTHFHIPLVKIWHTEKSLPPVRGLILPGGFSYGDYLRAGHLATLSPIMPAIRDFAQKGGAILGICNGFQILTEAGLLAGVLLPNAKQKFICQNVTLVTASGQSLYHRRALGKASLSLPIAHGQGRYYIDADGLKRLQDHEQIVLRYQENPNGSTFAIAGVCSPNGKVFGLMPHPERACDGLVGGRDGLALLAAFFASFL